jgi:hypothetical protein
VLTTCGLVLLELMCCLFQFTVQDMRLKFTHSCFLLIVPDLTYTSSCPLCMCCRNEIEVYMIALNLGG